MSDVGRFRATALAGSLELEVVPPGITEARAWRAGWAEPPKLPPRPGDVLAFVAGVTRPGSAR